MKRNIQIGILLMIAFGFSSTMVIAQRAGGEKALGVRLGGASGVTFKSYNHRNTAAWEFIAGYNFDDDSDGFSVTALWEKHVRLSGDRFSAFIGAGPTAVFNHGYWGASGIVGLDWRVASSPLNVSLDWMPTWFFINTSKVSFVNAAVSVRWILNNRKLKGKK